MEKKSSTLHRMRTSGWFDVLVAILAVALILGASALTGTISYHMASPDHTLPLLLPFRGQDSVSCPVTAYLHASLQSRSPFPQVHPAENGIQPEAFPHLQHGLLQSPFPAGRPVIRKHIRLKASRIRFGISWR